MLNRKLIYLVFGVAKNSGVNILSVFKFILNTVVFLLTKFKKFLIKIPTNSSKLISQFQ